MVVLIIMCIGTSSLHPVVVRYRNQAECSAAEKDVKAWRAMLYRCEAHCLAGYVP